MLKEERDQLLKPMIALVQVQTITGGGASVWESIAAFDVGQVAMEYAYQCNETNPERSYRVINLQSGRRIVLRKKAVQS